MTASNGDKLSEYQAVRTEGTGLIDLSCRARILVNGSEAIAFLNGLITNDMKTLAEKHWMPAAFPNVQGRLVASVRVIRLEHSGETDKSVSQFLLDAEGVSHGSILTLLNRFTLAGDFRVTDLTDELSMLSLQGKQALRIAQSVLGDIGASDNEVHQVRWQAASVTVVHATHTAEDGFDLFVPKQRAPALSNALIDAGARPVGLDTLEVLRIEAGLPRYNIDMDETNVVSETNLDEAISFTKGCYIGQEIIARIKYRGHVAKKLTGLSFAGTEKIEPGAKIFSSDEKEIGRVTSATFSPTLNRTIALAYVKYDYLAPGTNVRVAEGEAQQQATVTSLPFVRGSWYDG